METSLWNIIGIMLAIFGGFTSLVIWFMNRMENRLHSDITGVSERLDKSIARMDVNFNAVNSRIDANFVAINARIDSMGTRIDTTQAIIMRMLEKQGR